MDDRTRRLDHMLMDDDDLNELLVAVAYRNRSARDLGEEPSPVFLQLEADLLYERALRRQVDIARCNVEGDQR